MRRALGWGWLLAIPLLGAVDRTAPVAEPPASLAGSDEDGVVRARGASLDVDEELRRFFDHHLAVSGEEPAETTHARLCAALDARLSPRAAAEARELLDRYLELRAAMRTLDAGGSLEERWHRVRDLRRDVLGAEAAAAMFASDDADVAATLARRRGEDVLSPAEAATLAPLVTMQAEEGKHPGDVRALRERAFGRGGAQRLAELDRARERWQARLDAYQARRQGLDEAAADELRAAMFTPEERVRVAALERIAAAP